MGMQPTGGITLRVGDWAALGAAAQAVRHAVFVAEQGIPAELERDPADAGCLHAVAFDGEGAAVGTGRLLPQPGRVLKLGRMAVLPAWRGRGVGAALLQALLAAARAQGAREVMLHAQGSAVGFYLGAGFEPRGGTFMEAGLLHQEMVMRLTGAVD